MFVITHKTYKYYKLWEFMIPSKQHILFIYQIKTNTADIKSNNKLLLDILILYHKDT